MAVTKTSTADARFQVPAPRLPNNKSNSAKKTHHSDSTGGKSNSSSSSTTHTTAAAARAAFSKTETSTVTSPTTLQADNSQHSSPDTQPVDFDPLTDAIRTDNYNEVKRLRRSGEKCTDIHIKIARDHKGPNANLILNLLFVQNGRPPIKAKTST